MSRDLRLARPAVLVAGVAVASAVLVLLALALDAAGDRDFLFLAREPATAVRGGDGTCRGRECSYAGLLSNAGVLALWGAAGCAAACAHLTGSGLPTALAGATALLALDDMFLLHDMTFVAVAPEEAVYLTYGLVALTGGWLLRDRLRPTSWPLLAGAALLLAASSLVDVALPGHNVLEDGVLKLPGILLWSAFVAGTSLRVARRVGA